MSSKTFEPLVHDVDDKVYNKKLHTSYTRNLFRDQFSIESWIAIGAAVQILLVLAIKLSYALLPILGYSVYTIAYLAHAHISHGKPSAYVIYHRTTGLVPSVDGEIRAGTAGEQVAVLHLGFKNYSRLGFAASGYQMVLDQAYEMIAELGTVESRQKYGFLHAESYLGSSTPVDTSANLLLVIMYFRSIDSLHEHASSPLHRKAWEWYENFTRGSGYDNKYIGIMHEAFEAPPGKWETIYKNMERVGLGRGSAVTDDGSLVSTYVDASKGILARAKGRVT